VSLEELLNEPDLIQELKQQNSKLVEYLRDDTVLERLLKYVVATQPPELPREDSGSSRDVEDDERRTASPLGSLFGGKSRSRARSKSASKSESGETEEEAAEEKRLKYSGVACEVLSSEVWSISEALLEHRQHLRDFWTYLEQKPPLHAAQAGYFTKVNESLLDKKTEDMLDFIRSLDHVVPSMLKHIDCPMVMDLLLKIISLEKSEGGQGIVDVCVPSSCSLAGMLQLNADS
jgi:SIT4-associating protein SAP185/190